MTDNKLELLRLIFDNDNVEQAILTFADIISSFSKQHEANQEQAVAGHQLVDQTNQETL